MYISIDFWKLETENNILHVFSFLYNLSFENIFCFLSILSCQTSFLVLKIQNCFWKHKIRGKKKTITKYTLNLFHSFIFPSPQPNEPLKSYKEELKSHVVFWQLAQTLGGILASKPKINRIPYIEDFFRELKSKTLIDKIKN